MSFYNNKHLTTNRSGTWLASITQTPPQWLAIQHEHELKQYHIDKYTSVTISLSSKIGAIQLPAHWQLLT